VQEDLEAEEVHLVPHYNKHVKGVTKEKVEDIIIETTRPGPARRRTPRSNPMADADAVEETTAEDCDAYVEEFHKTEGGIMLCCDVIHKVLRRQAAYQLIKDVVAQKPADMQGSMLKALLGAVVLTRHNNKCYQVDDIDWEMSPGSKFVNHNGEEKSFVDHYKKHFGITIKDEKQPMLINRAKRHTAEEAVVAQLIALVPELCDITGLRGHWEFKICDQGGEAQDIQEVHHQADAWQEEQSGGQDQRRLFEAITEDRTREKGSS
jgi:hypothetical protein